MIGFVRGRLAAKSPPQVLIDVGGVGYEIEAPMSTFYNLPPVGQAVRLLTHLVVREDAHVLYGFASESERRLFRHLLRVAGIGPKIALAILSGVSVEAFAHCVRTEDTATLTRIPGVGRKTAERLLVEMRDRLQALTGVRAVAGTSDVALLVGSVAGPDAEAFSALVALGYKPAEATRLLKHAPSGAATTEELIRGALQSAAKES